MNSYLKIFASVFLASVNLLAAQVDFEHSFQPEGSGWGTDGSFAQAINRSEDEIPNIFKSKISGPLPVFKKLAIPVMAKLFEKEGAVLVNDINVCWDLGLPNPDGFLSEAIEGLLDQIAGTKASGRFMKFRFSLRSVHEQNNFDCSLLVFRGSFDEFPYLQMKPIEKTSPNSWQNKVYGIFYRHEADRVPAIVIHPDVQFTTRPQKDFYVQKQNNQLTVDLRTLIVHELGHYFGLSHMDSRSTYNSPFEMAMGEVNDSRSSGSLQERFLHSQNLWKYWDQVQTSAYRRLLWGDRSSVGRMICLQPGDTAYLYSASFMPIQDVLLQGLKTEYPEPEIRDFRFVATPTIGLLFNLENNHAHFKFETVEFHQSPGLTRAWIKVRAEKVTEKPIVATVSFLVRGKNHSTIKSVVFQIKANPGECRGDRKLEMESILPGPLNSLE